MPHKYVTVHLTPHARDRLRTLTLALSVRADRRLSTSEVLVAALDSVSGHEDEMCAAVRAAHSAATRAEDVR